MQRRLRLRHTTSMAIVLWLLSGALSPGVVVACAGAGEEGIVFGEAPKDFGKVAVNTTVEGRVGFTDGLIFNATILATRVIPIIGNGFTLGTKFNSCTGELGVGEHCERSVLFKPTEARAYESEIELEIEDNSVFKERHKGFDIVKGKGE